MRPNLEKDFNDEVRKVLAQNPGVDAEKLEMLLIADLPGGKLARRERKTLRKLIADFPAFRRKL